jgi:hypothetical protein
MRRAMSASRLSLPPAARANRRFPFWRLPRSACPRSPPARASRFGADFGERPLRGFGALAEVRYSHLGRASVRKRGDDLPASSWPCGIGKVRFGLRQPLAEPVRRTSSRSSATLAASSSRPASRIAADASPCSRRAWSRRLAGRGDLR